MRRRSAPPPSPAKVAASLAMAWGGPQKIAHGLCDSQGLPQCGGCNRNRSKYPAGTLSRMDQFSPVVRRDRCLDFVAEPDYLMQRRVRG